MKIWILLLALLPLAAPAAAQPARGLDAAAAQGIVAGCARHAAGRGQSHGIAVVDAGGHAIASLRMDGNRHGIMEFALAKARAAAAWGFATAQMTEAVRQTPGFGNAPYVVTVGGGVPVFTADGRALVGAVGVSGEAQADDIACAEAGIAAAGLRAARAR